MVTPSTEPPLMAAVVTEPRSATVLPALVQIYIRVCFWKKRSVF
jgi:hypothetical protein